MTSNHNVVRGNSFHDLRYAVHFMYTNHSEVLDNLSVGNLAGYAMMYSDHLTLRDNVSDADHDNGLLFNYANDSRIEGNVVRGSEKCVFIYNANKNRFVGNWFEGCQIGVHFTAGSEGNEITENAFVNNRNQVKYVGTRLLDWSVNGRGNYYSDNPAFDLKGTGIADTAYRPNDLMDQVIWRAPAAKMLLNSPAVQVVRWAQARFPAIHPGGVIEFGAADDAASSARLDAVGAMTREVVVMRGVSRRYRRQYAVREVDLTLEAGECVAPRRAQRRGQNHDDQDDARAGASEFGQRPCSGRGSRRRRGDARAVRNRLSAGERRAASVDDRRRRRSLFTHG